MKKLTFIGITLSLLLGLALWQQNHLAAVKAAPVFATTVTNTNDSGPGSLRQAIADAASGSTIDFSLSGCPCTITLTSGQLSIDKNLTINGPGANLLTISGNNASRVFNLGGAYLDILFGVPDVYNVTLSGVTIANGNTGGSASGGTVQGGGILNYSLGTINVTACTLSGNTASNGLDLTIGGAIASYSGVVNVTNSTLKGN